MAVPWMPRMTVTVKVGIGMGIGVGIAAAYVIWERRKRQSNIPTEWEDVGTVEELVIYPLKSARGIGLQKAEATTFGLRNGNLLDRSLVIFRDNGAMVTGRDKPLLTTISTSFEQPYTIKLTALKGNSFSLDLAGFQDRETKTYKIRGDDVEGIDCGDEVAHWLTNELGFKDAKVRLVHAKCNIDWQRPSRSFDFYKFDDFKEMDTVTYQDTTAYMIMNRSSLDELNSRIESPVGMEFYRSPIIISGPKPWDEDTWTYVRIGGRIILRVAKPCERCVLTTIDPANGTKRTEAFKELEKFRVLTRPAELAKAWKAKPIMGLHCGIEQTGTINVGDKVEVTRTNHPFYAC